MKSQTSISTKLGDNNPWVESLTWPLHVWGQRSCRGQLGSLTFLFLYLFSIWVKGHVGFNWGHWPLFCIRLYIFFFQFRLKVMYGSIGVIDLVNLFLLFVFLLLFSSIFVFIFIPWLLSQERGILSQTLAACQGDWPSLDFCIFGFSCTHEGEILF